MVFILCVFMCARTYPYAYLQILAGMCFLAWKSLIFLLCLSLIQLWMALHDSVCKPRLQGFFISYIIYNWPKWSHIFWTYILSSQKVKVKSIFFYKISSPIMHCLFPFHTNKLLANWKEKARGCPKLQNKLKVSILPLVYMMEFIFLLNFYFLPKV